MQVFTNITDEIEVKGFIDKDIILRYISEEKIFELVFEYEPVEFEYVTSPFREDPNPGCWFERDLDVGKLVFRDFAYGHRPMDCFDAVQTHFKLPNFLSTLEFIKTHLIDGKELSLSPIRSYRSPVTRASKVELLINTRDLQVRDGEYWSKYGISSQNLQDDGVYPVKVFKMLNTRTGDHIKRTNDICYAYTNFKKGRKKLYRPVMSGSSKFISTCNKDDIGEIDSLTKGGKLVITKSYKDCRVLRNLGIKSVWFQNEGMVPSTKILIDLCEGFEEIILLFDNDEPGIEAGIRVRDVINAHFPKMVRYTYLPTSLLDEGIKDPSDLYRLKGVGNLIEFLQRENIMS